MNSDYNFNPLKTQLEAQIKEQNEKQARRELGEKWSEVLTIDTILNERGKRYGVFVDHAEITQILKSHIRTQLRHRDKRLEADQQEALDMICHKIGRIINGDANYADSWIDIAGYAQLVADRLQGKPR